MCIINKLNKLLQITLLRFLVSTSALHALRVRSLACVVSCIDSKVTAIVGSMPAFFLRKEQLYNPDIYRKGHFGENWQPFQKTVTSLRRRRPLKATFEPKLSKPLRGR